ncbi:MAG TPA: RagB/SusD family nutrient uptake outer membrane protein [Chitinophagaceae bacterium]|nr:RagB/SusD family nutrient uptake outer membrane protein [Chitinophagaceae bacterium]
MKSKIIFGFLLSTIMLVSCKKDFLDRQPLDELVDATFYTNEETLLLAVNGTYAYLKGKGTVDMENMGDNTLNSSVNDYQKIASGNYANDLGTLNSEWATDYDGIRRCNAFLENYKKAEGREAVKEPMAGEVRFIRAYLYFYLTQFFGDVQLITKTLITSDPEVYGTRNKKAEVVDFILKELDSAALKLPITYPKSTDLGRITKGAALALKARVALYNQKWDLAEKAAKDVIDLGSVYQLYTAGTPATAYNDFFTYKGKLKNGTNKETILARLYLIDISVHNMSREAQVPDQASRWNPTKSLVDAYLCSDGLPINKSPLYKEDTYANLFKNRDPRMTQTILQPGAAWGGRQDGQNLTSTATWGTFTTPKFISNKLGSVTITGYYFTKYVELSTVALVGRDENDIHLIRLAEVLLTYAEARLEQGKLTQADIDLTINKLRQRVGMKLMTIADLAANGMDLRTEVRRERRVELALEGQRYFDILRWKQGSLLAEDIKGMKKSLAFRPSDVSNLPGDAQGYIIAYSGRVFTDPKNYLWPIPLTQLERNPNLGQNPGW